VKTRVTSSVKALEPDEHDAPFESIRSRERRELVRSIGRARLNPNEPEKNERPTRCPASSV
jgi:hypothetical protein